MGDGSEPEPSQCFHGAGSPEADGHPAAGGDHASVGAQLLGLFIRRHARDCDRRQRHRHLDRCW